MQRVTVLIVTAVLLPWRSGDVNAQFVFGTPENLGSEVNIGNSDEGPSLSEDGLTLYYASGKVRPGATGNGELYVTTRESVKDPWGPAESLGDPVNTADDELFPSISADGRSLYFCDGLGGTGGGQHRHRPGGHGMTDIWVTTRAGPDDEWGAAVNLGEPINSPSHEGQPSLSSDGLCLYFDSNRSGGVGGSDIWVSTRASVDDPWGDPVSLGPTVNGPGDEAEPEISGDGRFLFFRAPWDLWVTTRASVDDPWGDPVNLGPEINTKAGEQSPALSSDRSTLIFVHWDPAGGNDLYQVPILAWPPVPGFTVTAEGGEAPVTVRLDGSSSTTEPGGAIVSYDWDFGEGVTATGVMAEHTYGQAGRASMALTVTDDRDLSWTTSKTVAVGCPAPAADTAPWVSVDVGEPLIPGSARIEGASGEETLSICATGTPLSGTRDSFHFVHQEFSGDATLTAQVVSLDGGLSGAQVGVMLRGGLDADARYGAINLRSTTTSERFRFYYRDSRGERSSQTNGPTGVELPNAWVRIERRGEELVGSVSTDGSAWEEVERRTIVAFPDEYYGGIIVAGGEPADGRSFEALRAQVRVVAASPIRFLRGECNDDGAVDISDAVCLLEWRFLGTPAPGCVSGTDVNGDRSVDIADATYLLNYLFQGGAVPAEPFPACGPGTLERDSQLGCETPPRVCQ